MIALGWVRNGAKMPEPLQVVGNGRVQTVAIQSKFGMTAQKRLALLQECFDFGVNVVPLRCQQMWDSEAALQTARQCSDDILSQLDHIDGAGQLAISLSWSLGEVRPPDGAGSGRAWLQARQMDQGVANGRAKLAQQVLAAVTTGLPQQKMAYCGVNMCRLDVLIQRQDLGVATELIARAASQRTEPPLSGLVLSVTGLWPAFGFVELPQPGPRACA